jgi:RNA recognition motif-containing protein
MKSIYVGNLSYGASEQEINELFAAYGEVRSVRLIKDKETGKARGFGFVEMDADGADKAIEALEGKEFLGRNLKVNEAKPRETREPRGGERRRSY